jgi:hypothetical protein
MHVSPASKQHGCYLLLAFCCCPANGKPKHHQTVSSCNALVAQLGMLLYMPIALDVHSSAVAATPMHALPANAIRAYCTKSIAAPLAAYQAPAACQCC